MNDVLRWTCQSCGWQCDVPMPGYAGTAEGNHYSDANPERPCGPLTARLAGYMANPGTRASELRRLAAEAGV